MSEKASSETQTPASGGGWNSQLVVTTILLAMVLEALSLGASIVSIGLPSILEQFPTDQGGWLLTGYFLAGAIAAPVLGKMADLYGKRKMLLIALAISAAGAAVCALAVSFEMLVIGRVLQGVIMATMSLTYSLIRDIFPPKPAAFAASITVTGMGAFSLVSPSLIGWLVGNWGFRGMFVFDLIWTTALLIGILIVTPESPLRREAKPDLLGAIFLTVGVVPLLVLVSMSATWGWTSGRGLGFALIGIAGLVAFYRHTRRVPEPIINLSLFRRKQLLFVTLTGATGYALAATAGVVLLMLATTPREAGGTYGLGFTTLEYSLIATPYALMTVVAGVVLGTLVGRGRHPQIFAAISLATWATGLILLAFRNDTLVELLLAALIIGTGAGLANASVPNLVIRATPPGDQGSTAGAVQLCQTGFGAVAPVLMFAVLARHATITPGESVLYSELGFRTWLLTAAGFAVVILLVVTVFLWDRSPRPAAEHAPSDEMLDPDSSPSSVVEADIAPAVVVDSSGVRGTTDDGVGRTTV